MKKIIISAFSALLLMLMLTGTVLAAPAGEKEQLRFRGTLQAVENGVFNPGPPVTVAVTANGSGHATQLGLFSYSYTVVIYLNPDNSGVGTLYYTFVAANGDRLYSVGQGYGAPAPGLVNTNHVVETHIITGGTGRFAGATGNFIIDRLISNGLTTGTVNGVIIVAEDN